MNALFSSFRHFSSFGKVATLVLTQLTKPQKNAQKVSFTIGNRRLELEMVDQPQKPNSFNIAETIEEVDGLRDK